MLVLKCDYKNQLQDVNRWEIIFTELWTIIAGKEGGENRLDKKEKQFFKRVNVKK